MAVKPELWELVIFGETSLALGLLAPVLVRRRSGSLWSLATLETELEDARCPS